MTSQQRTSQVEPVVSVSAMVLSTTCVRDISGRYIAPAQTAYIRPDGPWRSNPRALDRLPNILDARKDGQR